LESIVRGAATYIMVWFIFRLTGKRTLAQITTFDAVLLLIISETTQASLIDENRSFTNALLLILTMLGIDDHGLDSLDRIKEAVLETTGEISVIRK
jgi:uncharacterized membrane protein YcaP (DUF421 family)